MTNATTNKPAINLPKFSLNFIHYILVTAFCYSSPLPYL